MATGAITITPGIVWGTSNNVTLAKLDQAANPTARVDENTIGRRELITAFVTQVDDATASVAQEIIDRADGDTALAALITSLTATVGDNTAAITAEATARADADTAISATITSLTATVGSNTAAITTEASARASADGQIHARWGVAIDINGNMVGRINLDGTNQSSAFTIDVTKFTVANSSLGLVPFQIIGSKARFTSDVEIDGSLMVSGSIAAAALNVSTLSAISANLGTVTAGTLSSGTTFAGALSAATGTFSGTLSGGSISGGTLDIGSGDSRCYIDTTALYYGNQAGAHVRLDAIGSNHVGINFHNSTTRVGYISYDSGAATIFGTFGNSAILTLGNLSLASVGGTGSVSVGGTGNNVTLNGGNGQITCDGTITARSITARAGVGGATGNELNNFWSSPVLQAWVDVTHVGDYVFAGAHTGSTVTHNGYVTMRDSGGTLRKFMVGT